MKKNVSRRGIFLVSIFIICAVAVVWRRYGTFTAKDPGQQHVRDSLYQQKRVLHYNTKVYSQAVRLANNGDVVVRLDTNNRGEQLPDRQNLGYSQVGVINREHDTVFVYYATTKASIANEQIFRESLWTFGHPTSNKRLGLYRMAIDSVATQKLLLLVHTMYNKAKSGNKLTDTTRSVTEYNSSFITGSFKIAMNDTTLFQSSDTSADNSNDIIRIAKKVKSWEY